MSTQIAPGFWPRCKTVSIAGNRLDCTLDSARTYSFTDAYRYAPHTQFLNLKTEAALVDFVRTWGPLYLIHHKRRSEPVSEIDVYWRFQRWLAGLVKLAQRFERARSEQESLRESLQEFVRAEGEWNGGDIGIVSLSLLYKVPQDPDQWIPKADEALIRKVAAFCIESSLHVSVGIRATLRTRHCEVSAGPEVRTLQDALKWMYWQDVSLRRPVLCCPECRTFFSPTTAHARKFCTSECAHRVAARNCARKRRAAQRRLAIQKTVQAEVMHARLKRLKKKSGPREKNLREAW